MLSVLDFALPYIADIRIFMVLYNPPPSSMKHLYNFCYLITSSEQYKLHNLSNKI
jgi:hypothetical protein